MITSKNTGVYKITNLVNNKFYIGSSTSIKDGFKDRIKTHIRLLNNCEHYNKHLQSAWNKYGSQNFKFEILESLKGKNEILEREQFYIDSLKATNPNIGYNKAKVAGSQLGYKHSEESKLKMSAAAKLNSKDISDRMKKVMTGRKLSTQTKNKISKKLTGIKRDLEFKNKISKLQSGRKHSIETKNKLSELKEGLVSKKRLKVYQLDLNGNIIKLWNYCGEIEEILKISGSKISAVCRNVRKTAGGFKWIYEKDLNKLYENKKMV